MRINQLGVGCDGKRGVGLNPDDESSNTYKTMGYNTKDFETWTPINGIPSAGSLTSGRGYNSVNDVNYDPYRQLFIFSTKRISAYADENIGMHYVSKNGIDFDFYDYVNNYSYDKSSPNLISFDPYYEFFSSNLTNNWNNVVTHENNSINYNKFTPYGPAGNQWFTGWQFQSLVP